MYNYFLRRAIYSKRYTELSKKYQALTEEQKNGDTGKELIRQTNQIIDTKLIPELARIIATTATNPAMKNDAIDHFNMFWKYRVEDLSKAPAYLKSFEADPTIEGRRFRLRCSFEEIFPVECGQVMEAIRKIYQYDDQTKGMSDQERLEYHQKHSGPVMKELREWIEGEFRDRSISNSSLGKAYQYLLNHFEKLTRFLSAPGTPIDNNAAERVLKRFVLSPKELAVL